MQKILGYVLLVIGLVIIGFVMWQSYSVFTDKTSAPLVFKTQAEQGAVKNQNGTVDAQINQAVQKQLNQILSPATITKILNLAAWAILAMILIFGGGVISGIGVKLIK